MPKKLFKRIMPPPEMLKNHRYLKLLGDALHDGNLWHLNRYSASLATFIGVFCAFIPVPFQMVLAAALAIAFHANLPLSVALVWISNPVTMPPIFYGSYRLGALILDLPPKAFTFELSGLNMELSLEQWWHNLKSSWQPLLRPLFVGSFVCGLFFGGLAYTAVRIAWRIMVLRNWRLRVRLRRARPADERRVKAVPGKVFPDQSPTCRSEALPQAADAPPARPDTALPPE